MSVQTVEVPFVTIGNRRALTDRQVAEQPWLADFMRRFPHCFERSDNLGCWFFYQDGKQPEDS